ncbi:hypothetical protein CPB83DRAFT_65033 [Crepidotus variabilis]|uniref:F-box domain-containing protein n=1 Tax=Crepidotus variabilis TaxID=179855 RepID=A0A9P6E5W6_9AGAR|nr:hypothetical protein CPB83DRAFT_65033 [Crepidotus variabilis]
MPFLGHLRYPDRQSKDRLHGATRSSKGDLLEINKQHDPMSSRLPVETIALIFQYCLPTIPPFESLKDSDELDWSFAQIRRGLTSVNRDWRDIAYSTPELWDSLFLHANIVSLPLDCFATVLTNMRRNLQNSRTLPLTIRLCIRYHTSHFSEHSLRLLNIVCEQACRWKKLYISAPERVLTGITKSTSDLNEGSPTSAGSGACAQEMPK